MKLLRMALRNTMRNKRRFAITTVSILFAVFVSTMLRGMIKEVQGELKRSITDTQTGDLQMFRKGYSKSLDTSPLDLRIATNSPEVELVKEVQGIEAVASRLKFTGMISNGGQSTPFVAIAYNPETLLNVCPEYASNIKWGKSLDTSDMDGIVVSEQLAKSFGLKQNDRLTLLARTAHGGLNTASVKVKGAFTQMMMGDKGIIYSHIETGRRLLGLENEATEVIIRINKHEDMETIKKRLEIKAGEAGHEVEFLTWLEIMTFFKNVMSIQNVMIMVVSAILFFLVTSTVINTIQMSVFERMKEIGMMKALGMKSGQLIMLFVHEGVIYGVAGGLAGLLLSQVVVTIIGGFGGLVYTFPMRFGAAEPWYVIPRITPMFRVVALALAVATGIIASIYPARKAAKLKIVDTLHKRLLYK
ncbi:MAG: FtsX-like permease family protein [Chitinivibrionales bacterium]|nr:FtsX-like permease family protein [Chitinivibrionales bacterium]